MGTVRIAEHGTLVASTVTTVTLTGGYPAVEIINASTTSTDIIWATVSYRYLPGSTTVEPAATPTVGGADTYRIPAGPGHLVIPAPPGKVITQVKLISGQTPGYSVQAYHMGAH